MPFPPSALNFRYEITIAIQYISMYDAFYGDLVIGYADNECLFQGVFYEKGRWSHTDKVEGVVAKCFRGASPPDPLTLSHYYLAPSIQNVFRGIPAQNEFDLTSAH